MTDAQRWTSRAGDAATEAILAGATADEIRAVIEAGIAEGLRIAAIRRGEAAPVTPRPRHARTTPSAAPGSAADALLRATGITR